MTIFQKKIVRYLLALFFLTGFLWIKLKLSPPLPINTLAHDEVLIAWFYSNRSDIEELVRRYRTYVPPEGKGHNEWSKLGDTPELLKRAGVFAFSENSPAYWLPDPYSVDARKNDGGYLAVNWRLAAKYKTLIIHPADKKRFERNTVWKDLVYFPMVPRIENNNIIDPVGMDGRVRLTYRIVSSLNDDPPNIKRDECALRMIESQWFVRMCRIID